MDLTHLTNRIHSLAKHDAIVPVAWILVGCICNSFALELLVRNDPGIGNLLTFLQFIFLTAFGYLLNVDFKTYKLPPRATPVRVYFLTTVIFFLVSVINNMAFDYDISAAVHMVFRSSSLVSSLLLGKWFFHKKYTWVHTLGAALVTVGIFTLTSAEAVRRQTSCIGCSDIGSGVPKEHKEQQSLGVWFIGIMMLTVALFLSALLGHVQEWSYGKYGKHWQEGIFYTHCIGMPYFVFFWKDIQYHIHICNQSEPWPLELLGMTLVSIPTMWLYLLINVITQIMCIVGVYTLTVATDTFTCNLTLTIRKFVSLILSILYFQTPFTLYHWAGTLLVLIGGTSYMFLQPKKNKAE